MKKKFALRAMALVLTLVFAASAFTVFSSAQVITLQDDHYTEETNTYGSSSCTYENYYYGLDSDYNYAKMTATTVGGNYENFYSTLLVWASGSGYSRINKNSDTEQSNVLTASVTFSEWDAVGGVNGYSEHWSTNKDDSYDYWRYNYRYLWSNCQDGWHR